MESTLDLNFSHTHTETGSHASCLGLDWRLSYQWVATGGLPDMLAFRVERERCRVDIDSMGPQRDESSRSWGSLCKVEAVVA